MMNADLPAAISFFDGQTDSKTAHMATRHVQPEPETRHVSCFEQCGAVLRNEGMHQNGAARGAPGRRDFEAARRTAAHVLAQGQSAGTGAMVARLVADRQAVQTGTSDGETQ
jgi:hypothetical protein